MEITAGLDRGAVRDTTGHNIHFTGGTDCQAIHVNSVGKQFVGRTVINPNIFADKRCVSSVRNVDTPFAWGPHNIRCRTTRGNIESTPVNDRGGRSGTTGKDGHGIISKEDAAGDFAAGNNVFSHFENTFRYLLSFILVQFEAEDLSLKTKEPPAQIESVESRQNEACGKRMPIHTGKDFRL
jgi:hypothetical protein